MQKSRTTHYQLDTVDTNADRPPNRSSGSGLAIDSRSRSLASTSFFAALIFCPCQLGIGRQETFALESDVLLGPGRRSSGG